MTRRLTVLLAGAESALVVAIGVAIPLVPLTIVWAAHFGFAPDWAVFWRASADVWLIGHGVDVTFALDEATAAALGMPGAGDPVPVTIAALGFALVTLLLGVRAGSRIADTGHRVLGELSAVVVFAVLSGVLAAAAAHPAAQPSFWQGVLLPTLVFAGGLAIGVLRAGRERGEDAPGSSVRDWVDDWRPEARSVVAAALRAGTGAAALTVLAASVAVAVLIVAGYAELIRLYEALHTELVGGVAVTAGELALLPNLVIWAACWFVGPGFAIGAGSSVSPLGTALGPVPAIPVLGAVPTGDHPFAFAGLLVPVVAAFLAGVAVRSRLRRELGTLRWTDVVAVALGGGAVGGAGLGLLAWASAGAAGPGRLAEVGPSPLPVALVAAAEFAVALALGLASGAALPRRRDR